jgi:hypothetical protein
MNASTVDTNHRFARHYLEMVVVMFVGMGILALPAEWATDAALPGVEGDDPTLMLARMAATMILPMIPWMRWRGHGWQACLEMTVAMAVPALAAIALLEAGAVEDIGVLMLIEHVAMLAAMFAVMWARPDEYRRGTNRANRSTHSTRAGAGGPRPSS